jgi:two-component system invasion response regulator UvrY
MPSVLIVDHRLLLRQGLRQIVFAERRGIVIGEAKTLAEVPSQLRKRAWDVVVVNLNLRESKGFAAILEVRRQAPLSRILVLGASDDPAQSEQAQRLGTWGYLSEGAERSAILKALQSLISGKTWFPDTAASSGVSPSHANLSARELEIMLALAAGKRTVEIAGELNLRIQTVSTYKHRMLEKMGFSSTADLVRYVIDANLA